MGDKKPSGMTLTTPAASDLLFFERPADTTARYSTVGELVQAGNGWINVKNYGAVGDGVTDDTAAIQAVADAITVTGGAVYFPSGKYLTSAMITFHFNNINDISGLHIFGDGASSQIYNTAINGSDCFYFIADDTAMHTLHIHDLSFYGAGKLANTGRAIRLRRIIFPTGIDNIFVEGFGGGAGIYIESCWMTHIDACWIQECNYGVELTNDSIPGSYGSTVNTTIQNSHLQHSVSHGIYCPDIDGGYTINNLTVDTCVVQGNGGGGIVGFGIQNLQIRNIYFEANQTSVTKADIFLEKCIFGMIAQCGSHYASGPYQSLTLDSACLSILLATNNWQGNVLYSGIGVIEMMSSYTTDTGVYTNHISVNSDGSFANGDMTPSVKDGTYVTKFYYTANTVPTTYSAFDDGYTGQEIWIRVSDSNTTFDFTGSYLHGNDGADYVAASGDMIHATNLGGHWYCTIIQG